MAIGMVCGIAAIFSVIEFVLLRKKAVDAGEGMQSGVKQCIKVLAKYLLITASGSFFVIKRLHFKHFLVTDDWKLYQYLVLAAIAVGFAAGIFLLTKYANACMLAPAQEPQALKKARKRANIALCLFTVANFIFCACFYIAVEWSSVSLDQLLVNMYSPTVGTEVGIYYDFFEIPITSFVFFESLFCYLFYAKRDFVMQTKQCRISFTFSKKSLVALLLCIALFLGSNVYFFYYFPPKESFELFFCSSDFIEQNYVSAKDVRITFPSQKRNLIFIYLESMENTYLSKELGGNMDENLMPELTELAQEGMVFSDNGGKFGGPLEVTGCTWSLGSMVNQTLGIPLKAPKNTDTYGTENKYISGAVGLGDILKEQGYAQTVMIGSDAGFGGLNNLYKTHGDYLIFDYNYAKKQKIIPKNYKVWWGFEDDKLYAFAKDEITRLAKQGKPFNFTMETADTHMPDGYLAANAPHPYESHYANAIAYSTAQTVKFVRWIQQQPFYENTTIVLIGDHLSMDRNFFKGFDRSYLRTQFNLILNPDVSLLQTAQERLRERSYCNFDMFPTTLAAMGCQIEGDRLGLGTNLFSDKETLLEQYGKAYLDDELMKQSRFYSETLCDEQ